MKILASICGFIVQGFSSLACAWMEPPSAPSLPKNPVPYYIKTANYLKHGFQTAKKQYLAQQTGKQKELRQPNAEEHNEAIEAAVRKELRKQLPQIVQSTSVQEQSLHIVLFRLPTKRKNIRNFSRILWIGCWCSPKDCKKQT